jgi:hypothetical protein
VAVGKRLRYEIFRRDNHTCRYCGAAAPDVPLRIDHVTPVALGGTDLPDNLVTACEPCNSGKTSTAPGAPLVADVAQDALRWSVAMEQAVRLLAAKGEARQAYRDAFHAQWAQWRGGRSDAPLPNDWRQSIENFRLSGLPATVWADIVDNAMSRDKVQPQDKFRYVCGIAWKQVHELQEIARTLAPRQDPGAADTDASMVLSMEDVELHERRVPPMAWWRAWQLAGGDDLPDPAAHEVMSDHCDRLFEAGAKPADVAVAAVIAGWNQTGELAWGLPGHDGQQSATPIPRQRNVECQACEEHDPVECLIEYLAGEWSRAWTRSSGSRPTLDQDVAFRKAAFEIVEVDDTIRTDHLFTAAVEAGRNESTDPTEALAEVCTTDSEAVHENSQVEWYTHWIKTAADSPPAEGLREALRSQVNAAVVAGYRPEWIVLAAAQAGFDTNTNLGGYLTTVGEVIRLQALPDPFSTDG